MMRALAQTASMRRRSLRLDRHRNDGADKRNQQKKSGRNPLHAVSLEPAPQIELRIKQNLASGKCRAQTDTGFCQDHKMRPRPLHLRQSCSPEPPGVPTNRHPYLQLCSPGMRPLNGSTEGSYERGRLLRSEKVGRRIYFMLNTYLPPSLKAITRFIRISIKSSCHPTAFWPPKSGVPDKDSLSQWLRASPGSGPTRPAA